MFAMLKFACFYNNSIAKSTFHFLLLLILPVLFSCNNKTEKTLTVGFSQCTMVNKFRQTMLKEMERELSFHPEINFIFKDANGSTEEQIKQVKELIDQKVDLLIVSPNEAAPITPIVEKAYAAKIKVIIVDRKTTSQNYTAYVGASNYEVGSNAAVFANSLLKGKGNVLEVSDIPGSSADIDRHKGFIEFIRQHPGLVYKGKVYEEGDENPSGEKLTRLLQSDSSVQLIFAQNDRLAFSASKVLQKLGLENKIHIIGVDGLPGENGGIDLVERGILKATILYPTGGGEAIVTAVNIAKGKPYKKENALVTTIIDSSNVRIMKLQNEKVLAQQEDIDKRQKKIEEQIAITKNQTNIILGISVILALALIFGGVLFYYLQENKKINKKLEQQKEEISSQRNQLIELMSKVKEATDAKFNFFTNISHELRTPLTLIMGPLQDALSSAKLPFAIKNNLEFIQRNTLRLLRLINQLMDFRKIEERKMKLKATENNLGSFVSEITEAFTDAARKKNISFNTLIKSNHINVWFDVTMLDKVLFNLLSNAFKFTPDNGSINIMVDKSSDDKQAIIKVEDNGVGMSTEDVEHAFDVFYQGHSSTFKGTGLGLALSKELIDLHHGSIVITSEKNKGTSFEITLPLGNAHFSADELSLEKNATQNSMDDVRNYTTDVAPITLHKESSVEVEKEYTLLLVEDNDDLVKFLKQRLEYKYEIHTAENSENGISKAFDIVPDLIISDIILPGQSGLQLTEKLKQDIRTSHIPIILLTAKSSMEEQIEGVKSQADSFIVKPFNLEYLEEKIKNLLKNRSSLREHYTAELPVENRSNSSNKIDRKFISQFTAIVENNLSNEDFSVDDICKEIGISRVQLYRKVKALLGYNVNDYLLTIRLQKAKHLLTSEDNTISEVAFKVGFASQAYFATVFKSKFGCTPSEFKNPKSNTKKKEL